MGHSYHDIAFTPAILELQSAMGSRDNYAAMGAGASFNHELRGREAEFLLQRDSFYMASVSETGWPYLQHRGGPAGFMKVLDERTIGFADYSGNRQYVSTGNFQNNDRVALFFMDYPNQRRLKMLGRVRIVDSSEQDILDQLEDRDYPVQIERAFVITVEGFDWNCPQHITPRFTRVEIESVVASLQEENRKLRAALNNTTPATSAESPLAPDEVIGDGPLELVVSGVRQLAPRVRAFELRDPEGKDLPEVEPGSHLVVPVILPTGERSDRHYSIASNPERRDVYEIAVLREEEGRGGSGAVHDSYQIGTRIRTGMPANHFALHSDERPALLIAGGIGITPIKAMAQALDARNGNFELHYAGRARKDMAFRDRLERQLAERLRVYSSADGERIDLAALMTGAAADAVIYVCGPDRLVAGVQDAAREVGISRDRVRLELFA
ncbi:MAG: pyridoxamine 5'-phosphate oxidase family protein [Halieaceae bacterium]